MHEAVIAQQIILAVRSAMDARGAVAVKTIDLDLGELEGLSREGVQAAFNLEAEGTPLEGAVLRVKLIPARAFCPSCSEERPFALDPGRSHEVASVTCVECGSKLDVRAGRGFIVQRASMVLEDP